MCRYFKRDVKIFFGKSDHHRIKPKDLPHGHNMYEQHVGLGISKAGALTNFSRENMPRGQVKNVSYRWLVRRREVLLYAVPAFCL